MQSMLNAHLSEALMSWHVVASRYCHAVESFMHELHYRRISFNYRDFLVCMLCVFIDHRQSFAPNSSSSIVV